MEGVPFGRYRLLESLGGGGMGRVWRAFDTETNRVVALKVLASHLANDPVFEQRFRREAFAAAGLNNPHVVPIHTYGEIDGQLFVDMRLIEGRNLQSVIADGPLDPARAVRIIGEVAKALTSAHKVGLVHRDVKPSNILLDDDDFAYLIDFGIARVAGEAGLTTTGSVIGTWHYMAPERLAAHEADARSDIYALACVLYETLTGRHPFPGDSVESQVAAHLSSPPPRPSTTDPGVPSEFDAVIVTGMAKDPDERYPTPMGLANAARDAITTPMPRPSPGQQSPPTDRTPVHVPPAPSEEPKRPPSSVDRATPTTRRPSTDAAHPASQPSSTSGAPVIAESTPRPRRRRKGTAKSSAIARLRAAGGRRWVVAASAVIGVALVGGLIALIVQNSKSSNTPTSTATSTSAATTSAPMTSAEASGPNETIADYIKDNNIQQTMITPGTPGAPTVDLPIPEGWTQIPAGADAPYGGIVFNTPTNPNDQPKIIAIVEKLTGAVDTYKLLSVSSGEIKNLPGYDGGDGQLSTLSGYPASKLGGSYTKDGVTRVVAQNTVVIQSNDGIYILQLNAEGPEADADALRAATGVMVQQTKITL